MDFHIQRRLVELMTKLFLLGRTDVAQIPYRPQKTVSYGYESVPMDLRRTSPERVGLSSAYVASFLEKLSAAPAANTHSVLVMVDGKLVAEASAPGYSARTCHLTFSMCKTYVGLAIGMLVDDGLLCVEDRVADLLPDCDVGRYKSLTVSHLLEMSSGASFAEAGSAAAEDWVRGFFESRPQFAPGTNFAYNSMNSYILSVIVTRVSGCGLFEFLQKRLFAPLGITDAFWECCPKGVEKGGWGLYLSPHDMAKIGQMCLDGGVWRGKRIISTEWLENATRVHRVPPDSTGAYNYGYHLWVARDGSSWLMNGMLGQNVWVCPRNRIVVVVTSGNQEFFQQSVVLQLAAEFFSPAELRARHVRSTFAGRRQLRQAERDFALARTWVPIVPAKTGWARRLFARTPALPAGLSAWEGCYTFPSNNQGLLPLMVRLVQNNHAPGIQSLTLRTEGEDFLCTVREGDEEYTFSLGFGRYIHTTLTVRGEVYLAAAAAEVSAAEGENTLRIELRFPELPNTRRMQLSLTPEGLLLRMSELPGKELVTSLLTALDTTMPKRNILLAHLRNRMGSGSLSDLVLRAFEPQLQGNRQPPA